MTKLERAIKALEDLPPERRDEIADMVLELAAALSPMQSGSALTEDQIAEVRARRARGFQPGDESRIDALIARLA